jgi:tetratricopeptide (TPR) repeat protein
MTNRPSRSLLATAAVSLLCATTLAGCFGPSPRKRAMSDYAAAVRADDGGDRGAAIRHLEAATAHDPNLTPARGMLGDLYRAEGDYANAIEQYEAVAARLPTAPRIHYKLGLSYQLVQRLQDAAASYLRALELDPRDANSSMNLGLVYLALGQWDDALRYTLNATLLDPQSAVAWSNLGVAFEAKAQYGRAETAYRRSLDLDPTNVQALLNLGLNLSTQGKIADAVSVLEKVVERSDTPANRKRYGDALAKAGRYDAAVAHYEAALAQDPTFVEALNAIGWVRIAEFRGSLELDDAKRQGALDVWRKSLEIRPQQPRIETALAEWERDALFRK